jgi:hypothetical protein
MIRAPVRLPSKPRTSRWCWHSHTLEPLSLRKSGAQEQLAVHRRSQEAHRSCSGGPKHLALNLSGPGDHRVLTRRFLLARQWLRQDRWAPSPGDFKTSASAAVSRQSDSTFTRDWWTRCTWPSHPSCSAPGSISLPAIDVPKLGYQCTDHVVTDKATHIILRKRT